MTRRQISTTIGLSADGRPRLKLSTIDPNTGEVGFLGIEPSVRQVFWIWWALLTARLRNVERDED